MRRALIGLVLGGLMAVSPPAPADGNDDPPFLPWAALLPSLTPGYRPSAAAACPTRDVSCVDGLIATMQAHLAPMLEACDDDAVLALAYLRFTEHLRQAGASTGFFDDASFIFHQDVAFAQLYFDAYDAWHRGDVAATPPSYRIAFDAADRRAVTGLGNGMLGLSAHINRDLPFILAEIGLVKPDGTSRKPDHDRVNEVLNGAIDAVLTELAARLDPELSLGQIEGTQLDEAAILQIFVTWREAAWRNAELLVNAPTPELRAVVAESIETQAVVIGQAIRVLTEYTPADVALGRRATRDAHCAAAT